MDLTFQGISAKLTRIDELVEKSKKLKALPKHYDSLINIIQSFQTIVSISIKTLDFLNNYKAKDDFLQVLQIIETISEIIINYLHYITSSVEANCKNINSNICDLCDCLQIFTANYQQIIDRYHKISSEKVDQLYKSLGLESILFSSCVKIESNPEFSFFEASIATFYKNYEKVNSIQNPISSITSFCGTGKTSCLPIMLLIRSLSESTKVPFLILTKTYENQIEELFDFFREKISKYVTVTSNKNEFSELINNNNNQNPVFGIFTPFEVLSLMFENQQKNFFENSRIIVDEIHERTTMLDVLIAKIAEIQKDKSFKIPLNVIFTSSSPFSKLILSHFQGSIDFTTFDEKSQFEIAEQPPIYEHFIDEIINNVVPKQTIEVINKMATISPEIAIDEGHIVCYLPGTFYCNQVKKMITSLMINDDETETKKKVVFLKVSLKHNESLEDFFERLREEYNYYEKKHEYESNHEFIYFLPMTYSGLSESTLVHLAKDKLPDDLKNINKLIFSTSLHEPVINDNLSVVIDSGIVKENGFDYSTYLRTIKNIQASKEIMNMRKWNLGRSKNGVYISILTSKNIPDVQTPPIKKEDLTKSILMLKDININLENLNYLPDSPDGNNVNASLKNLIYIGAIDKKTSKITDLGHEILQLPFINIYYAAAMHLFKKEYQNEKQNTAFFIAGYISTVLTISNLLVQEEMSENLSKLFVKESDIATLINALNLLLRSPITDNDELRNLVESYGFSYQVFCDFRSSIQAIIEKTFPKKSVIEVLDISDKFIEQYCGFCSVIDSFIYYIEQTYPSFTDSNYITFKRVNGSNDFNSHATLIFAASENIKFPKKRKQQSEITIKRRPGWNGLAIPTECYLFNITRNLNFNTNNGYLIHRATPESKSLISTIELDKVAMNSYFPILLEIYFKDLNLTNFEKDSKDPHSFYISSTGDRVFVSFISDNEKLKKTILNGANNIIKILPFTPRSVIILRGDGNAIVEVMSLGTENYTSQISTELKGYILNKTGIDYCIKNIQEMEKLDSKIRICTLFVNETCELKYFDQKNLYLINEKVNKKGPNLYDVVIPQLQRINSENSEKKRAESHFINKTRKKDNSELSLFQFPPDFIHPALVSNKESLDCILKWFSKFNQVKILKPIGSRLLMEKKDIDKLKTRIHNERETIKEQMNLIYVAIPIPLRIYKKEFLAINEHPNWQYNKKFGVIVTTKDESETVKELINSKQSNNNHNKNNDNNNDDNDNNNNNDNDNDNDNDNNNNNDNDNSNNNDNCNYSDGGEAESFIETNLFTPTLCCYYSCENPDEPNLTKYPVSVFFKDGSSYTSHCCSECLINHFAEHFNRFFTNGHVDQDKVENISSRPKNIPSVPSTLSDNGTQRWPVIPLGLLAYSLVNSDEELSVYFSCWLYAIEEYTTRIMMSKRFLWCNIHSHTIFDISKLNGKKFVCKQCCKEYELLLSGDSSALSREIERRVKIEIDKQLAKHFGDVFYSDKKSKKMQMQIQSMRKNIELSTRVRIEQEIRESLENSQTNQRKNDDKTDEYINGLKKCPACGAPIIKNGGCNHIECACGCHFCYICGYHSGEADKVYRHMNNVHGSIYDDDGDDDYDY